MKLLLSSIALFFPLLAMAASGGVNFPDGTTQSTSATNATAAFVTANQTNATLVSLGGVAKSGDTMTGALTVTDGVTVTNTASIKVGLTVQGFSGQTNDTVKIGSGGTNHWRFDKDGRLLAAIDNAYDIGASGANRPKSIFAGGNGAFAGNFSVAGTFSILNKSTLTSATDGLFTMANNGGSDFTRLNLGGTTTSFPAIARQGTNAVSVLADGSTASGMMANRFKMFNITVTPTAAEVGTNGAAMWVSNAVVYVTYSADGLSATTKQIAP